MYTIDEIRALQRNEEYMLLEEEKYCLVSLDGKELNYDDVQNQCNFCVLQVINAYKKEYISKEKANELLEKIETYEYTKDLLGPNRTIEKLNREIMSDKLNTPFFNSLCVICDDLYDIFT